MGEYMLLFIVMEAVMGEEQFLVDGSREAGRAACVGEPGREVPERRLYREQA